MQYTWAMGRHRCWPGIAAWLVLAGGCGGVSGQDGRSDEPSAGRSSGRSAQTSGSAGAATTSSSAVGAQSAGNTQAAGTTGAATAGGSAAAEQSAGNTQTAGTGAAATSGGSAGTEHHGGTMQATDAGGTTEATGTGAVAPTGGSGGTAGAATTASTGATAPTGGTAGREQSGGAVQGGVANAGEGGASAASGHGGTGDEAGAPPGGQGGSTATACVVDADCTLFADCCSSCDAYPVNRVPEACPEMCSQECPADAVALCQNGRCVGEIPCTPISPCGSDHYCDYPDDQCGRGDFVGQCRRRPEACDGDYSPVCPCFHDSPLSNECSALSSGLDLDAAYGVYEGSCVPLVEPASPLLGVWWYTWMGGNTSFFTIALCSDGRAQYVYADAPGAGDTLEVDGRYAALSPTEVQALFFTATYSPAVPQATLVYDEETDTLLRVDATDLYSPQGSRIESASELGPIASCE